MNLYRIFTRQEEPVDNQFHPVYHVWAESEWQAKAYFGQRIKHAVIRDVFVARPEFGPLLLLDA